jgi:hypothetical protein
VVTDREIAVARPLRFVVFGESIVSDWNNPVATSARAILSAIAHNGHEVTFLEQRGNPALAGMLAHRGSCGYRAFTDRYPEIQFRTYDLARGWERTVWFGREIATADAIVALPGIPRVLLPEIAALDSQRIIRLVDESLGIEQTDLTLVRAGNDVSDSAVVFGPAVRQTTTELTPRSNRPLVVAYGDFDDAESARERLNPFDPVLIQTGEAELPGWQYVPEVELPDWYGHSLVAVITGEGSSPWGTARHALALASGCHTCAADSALVKTIQSNLERATIPPAMDAGVQAAGLIESVANQLGQKRRM